MKQTIVFYILTLFLSPISIIGQDGNYKILTNDLQIIEKLNSRTKELVTFQCEFKQQKYMGYLDASVESQDKFMLKNPNKIRWEYINPYQYLIVINNGILSFKSQNQNEGTVPKENKLFNQLNEIVQSTFKGKVGQDKNFVVTTLENSLN